MDKMYIPLLLLSLFAYVSGQVTPELSITVIYPQTVYGDQILAQADNILEMECTVEKMPPQTSVQWFFYPKDSQSVVPISDGHQPHDQNKYKVERGQEAENSYKLTVQALQLEDSGTYQCKALYDDFAAPISESYKVEVNIAPYISAARSSTDLEVKAGDDVNLECKANGVPAPDVIWKRAGGLSLPIGGEYHSNPELTIRDMKPEYRGYYICVATNKIGEATLAIYVDMKFAPVIEVRESEAYQKPGYVKDLVCTVSGNPLPTRTQISWSKDGQPLDNKIDPNRIFVKFAGGKSSAETRLSIRPVREEDFGTYRCTAVNAANQAAHGTIKLAYSDNATPSRTGIIVEGSGCRAMFTAVTMATALFSALFATLHRMLF